MVLSKDLKIAICFGLIIGALLSICNLCFASEEIEISPSILPNCIIQNGKIVADSTYHIAYVQMEPGFVYRVHNGTNGRKIVGLFNSLSIGAPVNSSVDLVVNGDYVVNGSVGYLYVGGISGSSNLTFYRSELIGMTGFIDNIAYSLSIGQLSSVWVLVVPILAISVLVGLGVYFVRRIINKIKKKKGGI